jgi:hypothetical protein
MFVKDRPEWVSAAVRMTFASADFAHAFVQLGYIWLGTKRGLPEYSYESPEEEEHPILLPGVPDQPSLVKASMQSLITSHFSKDRD